MLEVYTNTMTIVVSTKINQINPTKLNTLVEKIMKKSNDNYKQKNI